jgi:hypothetical protein
MNGISKIYLGQQVLGLKKKGGLQTPIIVFTFLALVENMWLDHYANHSFCSGTTIVGFQ